MDVGEAGDLDVLRRLRRKPNIRRARIRLRGSGSAPLFDARGPFGGGGGAGARDEDAGERGGLGLEADRGEDRGPGAGIVGEDGEVGQVGGLDGRSARQQKMRSEC